MWQVPETDRQILVSDLPFGPLQLPAGSERLLAVELVHFQRHSTMQIQARMDSNVPKRSTYKGTELVTKFQTVQSLHFGPIDFLSSRGRNSIGHSQSN